MKLLIDIGNTRLKWALSEHGQLSARGAVAHRGVPPATWTAALDGLDGPFETILVANVAGTAVAAALREWAAARRAPEPVFVRSVHAACGVRNSYDLPETLGVDRWLGMIGGWARVGGPLVCVAAGTALTIDAVDAGGRHLGGLIVPGYELMVHALRQGTHEITPGAAVAAPVAAGMFGRNTAAAVELGASHAMGAVVERAVLSLAAAGPTPLVLIGGGDAGRLAAVVDLPHERVADLVLEGLAVLSEGSG